jgi:hypothetical protein
VRRDAPVGAEIRLRIDAARALLFGTDGRRIAAQARDRHGVDGNA